MLAKLSDFNVNFVYFSAVFDQYFASDHKSTNSRVFTFASDPEITNKLQYSRDISRY